MLAEPGSLGCQGNLAVDLHPRQNPRDRERGSDREHLMALERSAHDRCFDRLLDLPLRRNAEALRKPPDLEIEASWFMISSS
jgi:hypothetical protein